ncbi:actin nucleation-promoting factor WASL-like [Ruditapes philippinarum]|uniref:actin nucleation-promoting factor WASL-like n=1 Tax=Ruditapes philippinarum TaxID=129788 RepID=UPI00295BCAE1|nr:actin nucleation-promoting factor WASL-like [Ruditapes philippinarum]
MEKLKVRRNRRNIIRTSVGTGTSIESEDTGPTKKSSDKSKRKLTKEDIGKPTNVRHKQVIGWNPDTGLHFNDLDPDMRSLFEKIGITDHDHIDNETMKFIYDFVENHGGTEAFAKENREQQMKKQVPPPPNRAGPPPPPPSSYINRAGQLPPPPPSNINRTGPPPPPPPSNTNRAGPPPPPPPSNINRAGPPPPPPPSNINRAGPPPPPPPSKTNRTGPPPPPPPSNINRAGAPPPPLPSKAVPPPPPNRAGQPPPSNPSKAVYPPPPNRAGSLPPPPPSKVVPPSNSNKDKFGLPPPPSRNTFELPPPPPSRAGHRLSSPSNTDTEAADSLQETNQGATGESNPIKQQIMQLLLQNPAEITDFLYNIIDKRGGVEFIKDSLAQQMNKTHTAQENDQQPPDFTMQNVSDNINDDVEAASEPSNKSEVPGRRKTSEDVTRRRNAGEVPGVTRNLSPDYELSSDTFDDDDDEWNDLNDKVDQE